jgi:hypothetical protein
VGKEKASMHRDRDALSLPWKNAVDMLNMTVHGKKGRQGKVVDSIRG